MQVTLASKKASQVSMNGTRNKIVQGQNGGWGWEKVHWCLPISSEMQTKPLDEEGKEFFGWSEWVMSSSDRWPEGEEVALLDPPRLPPTLCNESLGVW